VYCSGVAVIFRKSFAAACLNYQPAQNFIISVEKVGNKEAVLIVQSQRLSVNLGQRM